MAPAERRRATAAESSRARRAAAGGGRHVGGEIVVLYRNRHAVQQTAPFAAPQFVGTAAGFVERSGIHAFVGFDLGVECADAREQRLHDPDRRHLPRCDAPGERGEIVAHSPLPPGRAP
jgi:hypothetical protein